MDRADPDRIIAEALARLEPLEWSGEVWRHTFADNPPDRRNVRGARWNPSGIEALYVSLARETALAEAEYLIGTQPLRPSAKRILHRLRVSLTSVVDLTPAAYITGSLQAFVRDASPRYPFDKISRGADTVTASRSPDVVSAGDSRSGTPVPRLPSLDQPEVR